MALPGAEIRKNTAYLYQAGDRRSILALFLQKSWSMTTYFHWETAR
jgi:hypothetical protein